MPEFSDDANMSRYYYNKQIVENSAIFSIEDLPAYRSGKHSLCYIEGAITAQMFSEPIEIKKIKIEQTFSFSKSENNTELEEAKRIITILNNSDFILPEIPNLKRLEDPREIIRSVRTILLAYFNIIWTPVYSSNQSLIISHE